MRKSVFLTVFSLLLAVLLCLPLAAANEGSAREAGTDLYVKAGGNGDGSSEAKAFGTLQDAATKAATLDGDVTIHVVGAVDFDLGGVNSYVMPEHSGTLTITGDGSGKINDINSVTHYWVLGGTTVFENITVGTTNSIFFITDLYDFTVGEGFVTDGSMAIYGTAGNESRHLDGTTYTGTHSITVLSGYFTDLAICRQNNKGTYVNGGVTLTVGGRASIDVVGTTRGQFFGCDSSTIILDGGQVNRFVANADRPGVTASNFAGAKSCRIVITENFDVSKSFTGNPPYVGIYGVSAGDNSAAPKDIPGLSVTLEIAEEVYEKVMGSGVVHSATFSEIKKGITEGGDSSESQPTVTEPTVTEPTVTEPTVTEPEVTEPTVTESTVTEPEVTEPAATKPEVTEPAPTEGETAAPTEESETTPEAPSDKEGSWKPLYTVAIVAGVVVLAAGATILVLLKKKKS